MASYRLRLYTDELGPGKEAAPLPETIRAIYVAEGTAVIRAARIASCLHGNCAWHGASATLVHAGPAGARLLRWELSRGEPEWLQGPEVRSALTLEGEPQLDPARPYLMRCDRVDFPPGGIAYTHTHQGSGIRCLQNGRIRVETQGRDFWVDPGGAWFETGPDAVYAETTSEGPSHFIRVMISPRALRGQSSIRYVKPEDQDKPKTQRYQVFVDEPIEL